MLNSLLTTGRKVGFAVRFGQVCAASEQPPVRFFRQLRAHNRRGQSRAGAIWAEQVNPLQWSSWLSSGKRAGVYLIHAH